jgi:macrolide transport system ATP-binding/permease protein
MPKAMVDGAPFVREVRMNADTAMFACGVALLAAALLALTPMLRLAWLDIHDALSEGGRGAAGRFWRRLGANLVVVELTVAVVLLSGAGLLGKSLYRLLHVDVGFDSEHVATAYVMAPDKAYPKPENWVQLYPEVKSRHYERSAGAVQLRYGLDSDCREAVPWRAQRGAGTGCES